MRRGRWTADGRHRPRSDASETGAAREKRQALGRALSSPGGIAALGSGGPASAIDVLDMREVDGTLLITVRDATREGGPIVRAFDEVNGRMVLVTAWGERGETGTALRAAASAQMLALRTANTPIGRLRSAVGRPPPLPASPPPEPPPPRPTG